MNFINKGTDELICKSLGIDLEKAYGHRGQVQILKPVKKMGKTYYQHYWVSPDKADEMIKDGKSKIVEENYITPKTKHKELVVMKVPTLLEGHAGTPERKQVARMVGKLNNIKTFWDDVRGMVKNFDMPSNQQKKWMDSFQFMAEKRYDELYEAYSQVYQDEFEEVYSRNLLNSNREPNWNIYAQSRLEYKGYDYSEAELKHLKMLVDNLVNSNWSTERDAGELLQSYIKFNENTSPLDLISCALDAKREYETANSYQSNFSDMMNYAYIESVPAETVYTIFKELDRKAKYKQEIYHYIEKVVVAMNEYVPPKHYERIDDFK